jgi:hypothetical protein
MKKLQFLTRPGLELRPLGRPARSQSLYWQRWYYLTVTLWRLWGRVKAWLHHSWPSALDGDARSVSRPSRFTRGDRTHRYSPNRGLGGLQSRSGRCSEEINLLPLPGIEPRPPARSQSLYRLSYPVTLKVNSLFTNMSKWNPEPKLHFDLQDFRFSQRWLWTLLPFGI